MNYLTLSFKNITFKADWSQFPFWRLGPVLLVHPFMHPWIQGLFGSCTLLPWIWWCKYTKIYCIPLPVSLSKLVVPMPDFTFWKTSVFTIRTLICRHLGSKFVWFMDPSSMNMLVWEYEDILYSAAWQPTQTAAIDTPVYGTFSPHAVWYMDPIPV